MKDKPAFPRTAHGQDSGMTMRQWYKGQALSGIDVTTHKDGKRLKKFCALAADLMIEEDEEYDRKET